MPFTHDSRPAPPGGAPLVGASAERIPRGSVAADLAVSLPDGIRF